MSTSADHGYFDNYAVSVVPFLRGDVTGDGVINGLDINLVATNWLHTGVAPAGDANEDGVVNGLDINLIASKWLQTLGGSGTGHRPGKRYPSQVPSPCSSPEQHW